MNALIKLRLSVLRMRGNALCEAKRSDLGSSPRAEHFVRAEVYDRIIAQIDRALKNRHDKTHDRRAR